MGTTQTNRTYALAEFPNTKCNTDILEAEIVAASLSISLASPPYSNSGNIVCLFDGLLTAADVTALDAVIAAHQGEDFSSTPIQVLVNAELPDDTGAEIERALLESGPLPKGNYVLIWSMQIACTASGGETIGRFTVSINGGSEVEVDNGTERNGDWITVGGSAPIDTNPGDTYDLRAYFQRAGAAGNAARIRRVRLFLSRLF